MLNSLMELLQWIAEDPLPSQGQTKLSRLDTLIIQRNQQFRFKTPQVVCGMRRESGPLRSLFRENFHNIFDVTCSSQALGRVSFFVLRTFEPLIIYISPLLLLLVPHMSNRWWPSNYKERWSSSELRTSENREANSMLAAEGVPLSLKKFKGFLVFTFGVKLESSIRI